MRFILLLILIFNLNVFSQNLVVEYEHVLFDTKDEFGVSWKLTEKMITNKTMSNHFVKSIDTVFYNPITKSTMHNEGNDEFILTNFKDLEKKVSFSECIFKKYNLADSIYSVNWTIIQEEKKILGYECQAAIGRYRGRDYIAYFSNKIPISNGPDKFDGLPGLILEVKSTDGCVSFIAKSIKYSEEKVLTNSFLDKPLISWAQYSSNYKKMFYKTLNNQPEENTTIHINNRTVEYIFED